MLLLQNISNRDNIAMFLFLSWSLSVSDWLMVAPRPQSTWPLHPLTLVPWFAYAAGGEWMVVCMSGKGWQRSPVCLNPCCVHEALFGSEHRGWICWDLHDTVTLMANSLLGFCRGKGGPPNLLFWSEFQRRQIWKLRLSASWLQEVLKLVGGWDEEAC